MVRHSVTIALEGKEMPMPEPVRYRNKETYSLFRYKMLRYRTRIMHAAMLIPAASPVKPMPCYAAWVGMVPV